MAIDRTKLKQIHNLLAQNGFAQDYSTFEKKFAGNANYGNRKKVYDLITENGGDIGGSYEDFMKRIQSKPQTTSQRAMQFGGRQLPKPKRAPSNASPFVQSLYAKDMAERGEQQPTDYVSKREDYTSPKAVQNMSRRSQMAGRNAAKSAAKEIDKQYMQSQPVMNTGTPADEYVGKTERQLEKQMSDAADQFVKNNMSSYIANAVSGEQDAALQRALNATDNVPSMAGLGGMGLMVKGKTFNEQVDPDLMIKNLEGNLDKNLQNIFSNPQVAQKIEADARNLGVSVDTYIQRIVPSLRNSLANALNESEYQRALPKNMLDNVANRFINSNTLGKMIRLATQTRSQRVMNEQAMAATAAGENPYYKSGAIENVTADVGGMVLDPVFGGAAKGGAMVAGKLLGSGAKAAAVMANGTLAQRLGMKAAQAAVGGGTTGFLFDATNSVVQNFSTGEDTSLGNTLKTAVTGGAKGAVNFGIMGLTGVPLGELGRGVGIKAGGSFWGNVGRATGKVSLEAGKTYMEAMGMYLGGYAVGKLEGAKDANGKPIEFDLFDGTLESLPTAIGFRVQHALGGLKGGRKNAKGEDIGWLGSTVANVKEFLTSDKAKTSNMLMSEDERQQIFNSGAQNGVMRDGENIVSYARRTKKNKLHYDDPRTYDDPTGKESIESDVEMMKNTYDQIMADPKVSWDAKAKFSAMVMGVMPDSRPMMDYCTFTTEKVGGDEAGVKKYINEYSADGTLLSKTSYDNVDKREQALYKMAMTKEGQRLWNVMGTLVGIDKNNYDYQNAFFMERVKDAKDGAEIQAFADGMGTKGSAVEQEFTNWVLNNGSVMKAIDAFAQESGMKKEDVVKLMNKDPLHRTEEEQLLCVKLRREMEKQAFPADKVHEEQSNLEGKDVADDNSLGTEEPNTGAVAEQLDNLSKAEEGVEALMRDNDVFGDNFKKMQEEGMTNPQIYDWMIQNGGMTQEQLKPFADYINANARVQGMQQRTQQKMEELVGKVVHDWSYRGTMNGVKTDGEQVLFVEDRDGRRLMVGSGDVAFDSVTGRAKEDVGDMLVCLDPETKELVYMKAEDAKFVGVQNPDEFANEYRQKLQEINSQPYNEAMQRQAERDAAKNQQETNEGETKTEVAAPETPMPKEDNPELYKVADSLQGKIGQSLSKDEADSLVSEMENRAEPARELELTPENWTAEFGEDGKVATPLGEVKMGENQYFKLAKEGRNGKLGLIKPTLEDPDVIIEDASQAKEGQVTERHSSYLFVKAFTGKDGNRVYYFTSVTVSRDGKEVVVSNQERRAKRIATVMESGKILYLKGNQSASVAQNEKPVSLGDSNSSTTTGSQGALHGINSPDLHGKDTNNSSNGNGNEGTLTHSAASYEKNDIPVDKDGEPAYEQVPKERTVEDLFGKLGGDGNLAHSFAEAKVAEAEKERKALLKKEPKMGTKINEYLKKKREHDEAVKAAEAKVAYWNDVKGEIEKLTHTTPEELKEQQAELEGTAATAEHKALYGEGQPADGTALAAKFVADAKITPESFKKETGFGTAEQAGFVGMIAKEENGGKSIERLAEDLVYYDNTEHNGTYFHGDTNEARNAIISALGAARTRKGLRELAQPDLAKFESERAQERDNAYHEAYGMDYEEYLAYSEQEMPHILEKINNFDEEKYLQDKAEEITNQIDKEHGKAIGRDESAGEEPVYGEGDKVLPGTRTDERGGGESPEEHAGRTEAERRSDTENAALPEEASSGAGRVDERQKEVDEAVKHVATEITKQTGIEVVTDEREGQSALERGLQVDNSVREHRASAGSTIAGMQLLPKELRMNESVLTDQILNYHGDYIGKLLENAQEDSSVSYFSAHDGKWYFYSVDKDRNINILDAVEASRENFDLFKDKLKEYGFDGKSTALRNALSSYGYIGRTDSDLLKSFLAGGTQSRSRFRDGETSEGRRADRNRVAGEADGTQSEGDTQEAREIRQFRTKDGEVYGFTVDGKIYLDTKKMKPETPLHEYTHLWTEALKKKNPEEWENVKKLFDEVEGLKDEVQKLYPEQEGDALYDEMIATYSGREGTKKLEAVVRELAAKNGSGVAESVKEQGFIYKVKEALQKYWKGVADMLHIHFTTAEEVADKVLADWAKGVNPKEEKVDEKKEAVKAEEPKLPLNPIERTALEYHEEKVGAARKAYEEAKASGDESEMKRTRDEFKKALDDKLKAQGVGLVQRRKEIANELGKEEAEKIDKPWKDMDGEERMAVAEQNPLTEEEIRNKTSEENQDLIEDAIDYLNGNHGFAQQIAYLKIYDDVRNRHENVSGDSGTGDRTQLDAANTTGGEGLGLGRGRESGGPDGPVDRGAGNEAASGERTGGESGKDNPTLPVGKQGDKQGEGSPSGMGGLSAGGADATGGGAVSGDGHVSDGSGRGGVDRSSKPDARRKPAAKQGTTWRNRTGAEIKQEAKEAKEGLKAALKEMLKRGRGEASISLTGLNSRQIEYVPELMKAVKRYGMSLIDQGIYKVKDWMNNIREGIYDDMKAIGFTDKDIDDFIEEMWNSKMPMDGETHTIAEWSTIYGNAQLRKKLSEKLGEKYERQMAAEPIAVKVGDRKNIEETLPFLLPQQQEDVLKAETQFFGNEHADREHAYGKGYLFTNGTGTGKTYTGLGIAKRLAKQGKGRILFVTPSQKKVNDWMKDGKNLGLDIRDLDSWAKERGTTATTESGEGMVITTFANFGLNKKLLETEWDAVIYDECHRIMENKKGAETARSMQHYMMTNRDENHCFLRLQETNKDYQKMRLASEKFDEERSNEIGRIMREYKESHPEARTKDVINATYKLQPKELNSFAPADAAKFPKLGKAYQEFMSAKEHYYKDVEPKLREQAKNTWKKTKTIFLSATPFNTRENLDYVEGYIFKYPEMSDDGMNGRTRFYLDHFGAAYKYRYHRLEQTVSNPDAIAKQEVAFSDYLQNTLGTMSGRIIDSPYDYSRDFPTVSPDHAEEFNIAVQDAVRGRYLGSAYRKTIGEYNYGSALFETMKVANIIDRIKQHLDAGRKVVIFHRRTETKTPIKPPFAYMLEVANKEISLMRPGKEREEYIREVNAFRKEHAGLLQWEKTLDYSMPREQLAKVFGKNNVLFFSGKESKTVKDKAVDTFNDDNSGKNIIVIQEASGKEGISLHDTTGKHQRVCITLGLPQSPITALQIEGRTYRIGNKSNAIFEYPVLGLNSEMMLFGEKFNNQVSTTENLALGSQARNLRESFAKGILEHSGVVPIDQQGVGGKEFDAPKQGDSDPFDDAVLDYYSNQKLNRKNREGVDYFPTPEPLGYKMMEWARAGEGDTILEPSAGHGAIARYAPKENQLTGIEPSQSLFAKLQLKAGGLGRKFMNTVFENYDISNKHDVVVMNPPFGTAGATAIAHLDKAFKHLEEGGRVVAIIPRGSTDKKFDKWLDGQKNVAMRAEVDLPDIVFQQAGTSVVSRVVVLDKITDAALRSKAGKTERIDLSGRYDKIEDFFEELRNIEMPERIIDTQAKMQKKAKAAKTSIKEIKGVRDVKLDKNGILVSMRGDWMDYGISFSGSDKPQYWREKMSNFYEKYEELEKSAFNEDKKAVFSEMKELSCKLAGMTEDEMQRYIAGRRNSGEQDGVHFRTEEDIEDVNKRFNERLESLKADPKQKGGELKLGYPGTFLKDAGFGDSEIVLEYAKIERKSSEEYKNDHPFDVEDIKDLPKAINTPIAVFDNTNGKEAGKTILTELQKDGKNFIVAIRAAERRQKGGIVLEVNEIKTLFPKEARGIVNWFNTGKTCNVDKEKALTWLGALRTHRGTWLTEQELSSATNVVKDFDIEKRKSLNFRIGDNKTEKQNNSVATISEDAPVVVKHVDRVSKETGVKVNMVQSAEEVNSPRVKKAIEDGKEVTGWYDERTGEVHLYMPNIHDRYTAEKTIWHETVGHKGMRGLMGEQFDKFLRDMWYDLDKPENAELKKLVDEERRRNPLNIYDAIEEGIARLAEEGRGEPGFWRNIRNKVTDFFREIGYRIAPNTKDVKYLLWLSKNLQKNPNDVFYKMRAEAVRWRLDHEAVPDVIEANGMFFDNDGKNREYVLDLSQKDFEQATDGKIHFRTSPATASKIEEYNRRLEGKIYSAKESTVDYMQSVQEYMETVSGKKNVARDIPSSCNPLQAENRSSSISQKKCDRYDRKYMTPLDDVFKKVISYVDGKNSDFQKQNTELYMIMKHGLERNRVFFVRDRIGENLREEIKSIREAAEQQPEPKKWERTETEKAKMKADALSKEWEQKFGELSKDLEDGKLQLDEYYGQMDEWIRSKIYEEYESTKYDYSGLTDIIKNTKDWKSDADIIEKVKDVEKKINDGKSGLVKEFWEKKRAATDAIIDSEYDSGKIDKDSAAHFKSMFNWYVPLRKFNETTAEDVYGYITESGDPSQYIGSVIAKANGRKSLSDTNVMAQIFAMAKSSIISGEKNIVKQYFARFVEAYETGEAQEKVFVEIHPWAERHVVDGKEVWEEVYPQVPEDATQHEISDILQTFEDKMRAKEALGEARLLTRRGSVGYKFQREKNKNEHIVEVYIAGKKRMYFCQGNPRAAQAINGLLHDSGTSKGKLSAWISKKSSSINRTCAQLNTSYNPDFFSSNMVRDFTVSSAILVKEGPKYAKRFCREYYNNLKFLNGEDSYWKMLGKYNNDKIDESNTRQKYFKEFMDNGGQTGFVQLEKLERVIKEYNNLVKTGKRDADGWFARALKKAGFIEIANETFENIARYSCYVTSRESGRSIGRSVYDAKEVSGNFNRHGSGDAISTLKTANDSKSDVAFRNVVGFFNSYMKNHTMFYNAGVQGANMLFKNYKFAPVATAMSLGVMPFALNMAIAAINQFLMGIEDEKKRGGVKDPYAELPEWKRRNNINIYIFRGHFFTLPLGIELRAFYGLGDVALAHSFYDGLKSDTPIGYDILGQLAQLVPSSDFLGHHAPGDNTTDALKDVALAVTPTALKAGGELVANRDWTGRPIYRDQTYLDIAPRWKRAYDSTNEAFVKVNKLANKWTADMPDATEDMKGNDAADFWTAPYGWQHMMEGYVGGMGATIGRVAKTGYAVGKSLKAGYNGENAIKDAYAEWEKFDKNQIPLYRNFIYTSTEGHDMQRTKSKWYNYTDELRQTKYNLDQLKTNTPDLKLNLENEAKKYKFSQGKEGRRLEIWNAANSYIGKKKNLLKKTSDPEVIKSINNDINLKMQEAVRDLDKLSE
jgi:predicted RNA methylase